jgi:hypothetical protein
MSRERKIGAISGMVDKLVLHDAGEAIIEMDEAIQEEWPIYKKLGGTATGPQAIPRNPPNPCAKEEAAADAARQLLPPSY